MNARMAEGQLAYADAIGVRSLTDEELLTVVGGAGPIAVGCLVAFGGAALAVAGLAVGVAVYYYVSKQQAE